METSHIEYICEKIKANLRAEASRSFIGFGWWLFEPLIMLVVFYFVFGILLQRGGPDFVLSLIVGIAIWTWFAASLGASVSSIMQAGKIISQIYIPKWIFPVALVLEQAVKQVVVFAILVLFLIYLGAPTKAWWALPVLIFLQLVLHIALGLTVAAVTPFFPDMRFIVPPLLRMLMFCSGVFYSIDNLPEQFRKYFMLNPIAGLIEQYRAVLIGNMTPDFVWVFAVFIASLLIITIALLFLKKYDTLYSRMVI